MELGPAICIYEYIMKYSIFYNHLYIFDSIVGWTLTDRLAVVQALPALAVSPNRAAPCGWRCETASRPVQCLHGHLDRV